MKKKVLFILSLLLLTGCGYDEYEIPEDVNIKVNENKFELFTEHTLDELVDIDGAKLLHKKKNTISDKVGTHKTTISYRYKKRDYKYDVKYQVVDVTPPFFLSVSSSKTVLKNKDIDPCGSAVYIDDYDKEPICIIEGVYDLTKTGTYDVKYVLSDNSGNTTKKDLKIKVVDKYKSNNSTTTSTTKKLNIEDVIKNYKNDNTMIGIDVSRWQGDIDYEKVKNNGIEFVIMRIGVQSSVKGDIEIDSYYMKNIENAKKAGLKVGVYVYSTAVNSKKAKEHARWVAKTLDGIKLDFPIAFDWENWAYLMEYNVSTYDLSKTYLGFHKEIERLGYESMLYSSKFYLEKVWMNLNNAPVWLAHYTSKTNYEGDYIMWQMSASGKVDGIDGDVDINIYYKEK